MNTPAPEPSAPTLDSPIPLVSRVTDIVAAPGDLFDRLKASPPAPSSWLVPLITLVVVSWIGATLLFSQAWFWQQVKETQEAAIEKSMKSKGVATEQIEQTKAGMEKVTPIVTRIMGYAGPPVIGLVICFWYALYLWLIGTRVMRASFTLAKAAEVSGLVLVIDTLGGVVKTLLILVTGNLMAAASPVMLFSPFDPTNVLHNALAQFDLFALWALALRSLGLAKLTGRPFAACAAWIFGFWLLFHGALVALGALGQRFSG